MLTIDKIINFLLYLQNCVINWITRNYLVFGSAFLIDHALTAWFAVKHFISICLLKAVHENQYG